MSAVPNHALRQLRAGKLAVGLGGADRNRGQSPNFPGSRF
jgi:hypothetical protein